MVIAFIERQTQKLDSAQDRNVLADRLFEKERKS